MKLPLGNTRVRQGDGISPVIFNLDTEESLRRVKETPGGAYIGGKINVSAYADDVALIAENSDDLKALADKLLVEASKVGLMVNEDKTQYMKICRRAENEEPPLRVMNFSFELTKEF